MKEIIINNKGCVTIPRGYMFEGIIYGEDTVVKIPNKYNYVPGDNVYPALVKNPNKNKAKKMKEYNDFYAFPYYTLPRIKHPLVFVGREVIIQRYYDNPMFSVKYCPIEEKTIMGDKVNFIKNLEFPFPSATEYFKKYPEVVFFGCLSDTGKTFVLFDAYDVIDKEWKKPDFIEKYRASTVFKGKLPNLETIGKVGKYILRSTRPFYTGVLTNEAL